MNKIPNPWAVLSLGTPSTTAHKKNRQRVLSVFLLLLAWQLATAAIGHTLLLPTPLSVLRRLSTIWMEQGFGSTVWFTFHRIVSGFLLALAAGCLLGTLAGHFPVIEILFFPFVSMIKSVPVASFIVICLIWLSSARLSVFISFLMVLPIIYLNILKGIQSAPSDMLEVATIYHMPWHRRLRYLWLPQIKPFLLSGCSIGLGLSWKAGIAAEIIGIPKGSIGRMFYNAKIYLNTVDLFSWTVIVVIASILFEKCFMILLHKLFRGVERL